MATWGRLPCGTNGRAEPTRRGGGGTGSRRCGKGNLCREKALLPALRSPLGALLLPDPLAPHPAGKVARRWARVGGSSEPNCPLAGRIPAQEAKG